MPVLVYTESDRGTYKKNAAEAASYASALAASLNTEAIAISFHNQQADTLKAYGIQEVLHITDPSLAEFNAKAYADAIAQAAEQIGANTLVLTSSSDSKYLAPILAAKLHAAYAPNVVGLPETMSPLKVKRSVFSNKAFAETELKGDVNIIGLSLNSYGVHENASSAKTTAFAPSIDPSDFSTKATSVDKATNKVSIADADIVVSGGRGLKGPENWGMIEELAEILGAATACSKPVSDMGWRPHSEHVGQTGKPVASNLYIAIGISGAIQHLAGVSASKVKLVINNDPEAPFFKAADYGVVGDAFEVVPKLIEKLKAFKTENA
jgi:electron transfer flavoprotein alpha subunit